MRAHLVKGEPRLAVARVHGGYLNSFATTAGADLVGSIDFSASAALFTQFDNVQVETLVVRLPPDEHHVCPVAVPAPTHIGSTIPFLLERMMAAKEGLTRRSFMRVS